MTPATVQDGANWQAARAQRQQESRNGVLGLGNVRLGADWEKKRTGAHLGQVALRKAIQGSLLGDCPL